jgi:hypothetical protein
VADVDGLWDCGMDVVHAGYAGVVALDYQKKGWCCSGVFEVWAGGNVGFEWELHEVRFAG